MSDTVNISKNSKCVDQWLLRHYINGTLPGTEEERVTQHIGQCEMCADEVEGMTYLSEEELEETKKKLHLKLHKKWIDSGRSKRLTIWVASAACIAIAFGTVVYQMSKPADLDLPMVAQNAEEPNVTKNAAVADQNESSETNVAFTDKATEVNNPASNTGIQQAGTIPVQNNPAREPLAQTPIEDLNDYSSQADMAMGESDETEYSEQEQISLDESLANETQDHALEELDNQEIMASAEGSAPGIEKKSSARGPMLVQSNNYNSLLKQYTADSSNCDVVTQLQKLAKDAGNKSETKRFSAQMKNLGCN